MPDTPPEAPTSATAGDPEAGFLLDPRLEADTIHLGDLPLSRALLMNDARFPWLILVPRRAGASEIADLDEVDATALMGEIRLSARLLAEIAGPDKTNVGALGNIVTQLHVHIVARFLSDPAWPGPVWGHGARTPYPPHAAHALVERLRAAFAAA